MSNSNVICWITPSKWPRLLFMLSFKLGLLKHSFHLNILHADQIKPNFVAISLSWYHAKTFWRMHTSACSTIRLRLPNYWFIGVNIPFLLFIRLTAVRRVLRKQLSIIWLATAHWSDEWKPMVAAWLVYQSHIWSTNNRPNNYNSNWEIPNTNYSEPLAARFSLIINGAPETMWTLWNRTKCSLNW